MGLAQSAMADCAKATVSPESGVKIEVLFDLSGCGESGAPRKVTAKITENEGTAKVTTSKAVYLAKLTSVSAWGSTQWSVSSVTIEPKKMAEKAPKPISEPVKKIEAPQLVKPTPVPSLAPQALAPQVLPSETPKVALEAAPVAVAPIPAQVSGLIDVGFVSLIGKSAAAVQSGPGLNFGTLKGRFYDQYSNSFQMNLAELTVKKTAGPVSFVLDLDFGTMADFNATAVVAPYPMDEVSKHVGQAVVSWTPVSAPWLLLEAGKLPTPVGYEVMKAKDNWQYSRSMTYSFGMPIWHTGLHAGFTLIPSKLSAGLYLVNGWNSLYDVNAGKTLAAQIKYTPTEAWTFFYNVIGGPEQPQVSDSLRIVHEANVVFAPNSTWNFALEALSGSETNLLDLGTATWAGVSHHAKWTFSANSWLSSRVEWFNDAQGWMTGGAMAAGAVGRTVLGGTLTNGWTLADGLEARVEVRYDQSTQPDYVSEGAALGHQTTASLGILYSF